MSQVISGSSFYLPTWINGVAIVSSRLHARLSFFFFFSLSISLTLSLFLRMLMPISVCVCLTVCLLVCLPACFSHHLVLLLYLLLIFVLSFEMNFRHRHRRHGHRIQDQLSFPWPISADGERKPMPAVPSYVSSCCNPAHSSCYWLCSAWRCDWTSLRNAMSIGHKSFQGYNAIKTHTLIVKRSLFKLNWYLYMTDISSWHCVWMFNTKSI